jgi:hypothetical protein
MGISEQRIEVLRRVERGELTAEEGAVLLGALERGQQLPSFEPKTAPDAVRAAAVAISEPVGEPASNTDPVQGDVLPNNFLTEVQIRRRKLIWLIPFLFGLWLTSLGGVWMVRGYQKAGLGWGFWLSWIPFLIGVGIMVLGWGMRRGCWLHVRVHQKEGSKPRNINLSFPIPLRLTGWFFRNFGDKIPNMKDKHIDEILEAIETGITPDAPMIVQVDEDDQQVEVWIECS